MTITLREMQSQAVAAKPADTQPDGAHESARLAELDGYDILDTPPEEAFDRLTRVAKRLFGVSAVAVSFIDAHRQWHKSSQGLTSTETPREHTFCRYLVETNQPLVVSDTTKDPRFATNPSAEDEPGVRFYAGAPLRSSTGTNIGSFSLFDTRPREFTGAEMDALLDFAQMAMDELDLRRLSPNDPLTGVLSRRSFREHANREIALARRHHDAIGCVAFGFDHFKAINQAHGRSSGDAILSEAVRACHGLLRDSDIFGRLGGDQFAVVLPKTGLEGAMQTAERLRAKIAALPFKPGNQAIHLTASFGVAAGNAATADVDALLDDAETALHEAKSTGRNRLVGAAEPPIERAPRHRVLKSGEIIFNGGAAVFNCTVRSLSPEGAGLDVSSTVGIPRRFSLSIKADDFKRQCTVETQTERHLDVAFDPV